MWKAFIPNSTDEETVNNAFCTNSLFRISSEIDVTEPPRVQAQIQNKRMMVCADNSLILLQDENVMECNLMCFGAPVDCFAISQSGNVVVCALADGNIHGIFIKGVPIFNICVQEEDIGENTTFAGIKQIGEYYYIVCKNGKTYRLYNVDEKVLENYTEDTVCENESRLYNDTILNNTVLERLTTRKVDSEIKSFCCITSFEKELTEINAQFMMCSNRRLYIEEDSGYFPLHIPESMGGLKSVYNLDQMIIGLSYSGQLFEICPYTKIIFEPFGLATDYIIDEFIVLENNQDDIELLLLTKPNNIGRRWMKIVAFPSMKCKSELSMPNNTWLVQQQKTAVNMYYMTGDNLNNKNIPQEIEMKIISETQPQERLKKLIYKGRLDEAEEFGRQFNLNLQPICEAKAKRKLLEISALDENQDEVIHEKFIELQDILKTVENNDFFLSLCGFEIPSREIMEKFLNEMLLRLVEDKYLQNVFEIKEQLLRLETLNLIDPYETNLHWQKFIYHPNIVKVCRSLFKTDMLSASLVWKRHAACVIPLLDLKNILQILNAIPQATEAFYVVQWLRYFIPSVLQTHVTAMSHLVEWSIQKTRSLQYSNHWPDIGLEFSMKILSIFEDIEFLYSDFRRQYDSNNGKLKSMVKALQDLSVLKKSYNVLLTLDNYVKDSLDDTALRILQGVQLNNLKTVVNDFLSPIYLERGKTPRSAIKRYITYLVKNRKNISYWFERAVVSTGLLHNEEEKLEFSLLVLKNSSVPWPDSAKSLLKLSNSSHPLAAEIRTQFDLQIIKLLKQKYGWPFDSPDNHMKLAFRIVKAGLPEMILDIEKLVKVCPEITGSTNFYCCYEMARKGQTQRAVQFLRKLQDTERSECYEKIISILTDMFSNPLEDVTGCDFLFQFLRAIAADSEKCHSRALMDLQRVYMLDRKFSLKISVEDLKYKEKVMAALLSGIHTLEESLKRKQGNVIHFIWTQVSELSTLLGFEKMFGIVQFAKRVNQIELSCALAYFALTLEQVAQANYEIYIDFSALLISQHINVVVKGGDTFKSDPLVYPLVYKLLIEAMKFGKVHQFEIIEFFKWICVGNEIYGLSALQEHYGDVRGVDIRITEKNFGVDMNPEKVGGANTSVNSEESVFDRICDAPESKRSVNDPNLVAKCVSVALLALSMEASVQNLPFRLRLFVNGNLKESENDIRILLTTLLSQLVKCKQYNSWYKIVQCTKRYQSFDTLIPKKVLLANTLKMFRYLLSQKEPNFTDLFAMLTADSNCEMSLKYLENELRTGQSKLNLLILSEMYHTHVADNEKITLDREQRMKYYYYTELIKQDPELKFKANIEFMSISALIKELKNKLLDISLLRKLSSDFDCDYQQVLVGQIITALNMQEPIYDIKVDAMGREEMVMKISTEKIRDVCQSYLAEITDTGLLAAKLLGYIAEVNFYFYELYLCVIDILTYINGLPKEMELWANMLLFLKHKMVTKRRHRAGQMEMDWWLRSQQEVGVLPKIAKYRFPFMPLVQEPLKNILDDEINVDNCQSWFPLVKLHTVNNGKSSPSEILQEQEYFCMSAVKNSISEYKQHEEDTDIWHLQPVNNAFLQSIVRLIQNMSNLPKILFILYFVTNHAREGADQVEAAAECYKFATENEKHLVTNKKAEETVIKIKRKYPLIKTQHLLHIYGLVDEKLLELAENPKDLIHALYHHDSILKTPSSDINSLVGEISLLHDLNFRVIQISMVKNWLSNASVTSLLDAEDTFYEDMNTSLNGSNAINNEHIIRAHYVLHSWKSEEAAKFLVGLLFPVDGPVDTAKQLQIFECFCKLIDETSASYITAVKQEQYISLKCVHYMKQLGYNINIEKFTECNKLNILKKIWENHASNKLALEAVSYICISHDIYIPKIWSSVLKQMVNLNMLSHLNGLVDMLSCKTALLNTDGLLSAWEYVLREPFKHATRFRSFEQDMLLSKNLFRIQACPVIRQLNIVSFAEECIRLDRPHMAAVFVVLANKGRKDIIIAMILNHKKDNLKEDIIELAEVGIAPTILNYAINILNL